MEIEIIQAIQSIHSNVVLFLTTFVSYFSSWIGFVFILITFLLFARFRFALTFAIASGVVSGVVNIVKVVVQRPRPWVESEAVANLLEASGYSMPSGHTANSVVIAVFLCYFIIRTIKTNRSRFRFVFCAECMFFRQCFRACFWDNTICLMCVLVLWLVV